MKKCHVKAFSLMEVTIVMLLTALVVGITFTSYTIIIRSYNGYRQQHEEQAELVKLNRLLLKDLDRCETASIKDSSMFFTNDSLQIAYFFSPHQIIRSAGRMDTFKFEHTPLNALFENTQASGKTDDTGTARIDELTFSLILHDEKIPYHYHKTYSSANLIERP